MKTRRDFIKISALGTMGAAMATSVVSMVKGSSLLGSSEDSGFNKQNRYPTYCEVCFWKCAGWTYTDKQGKILKIIGNENDPHCNGRLCPRGTGGIGMYYDSDRLTHPLIRVENNGKQEFRKASWKDGRRMEKWKDGMVEEWKGRIMENGNVECCVVRDKACLVPDKN